MYYKLTNGEEVNLRNNTEVAKFIYLVAPFKRLKFAEGVAVPHVTVTKEVSNILQIHNKLMNRKLKKHQELIDAIVFGEDYDDECPF
ncbi:hypothetical protein [Lundtoftevirus Lu221]|uniref:Uncharacterized protein n=1 Tax=phage PKM.Lu.22.1 TaxID=3049197 RepID=A0AAF0R9J7_9CAUD|nr:hypothetical protein [phage PKM.Lu.22.1]